jgi:hypothetical protein
VVLLYVLWCSHISIQIQKKLLVHLLFPNVNDKTEVLSEHFPSILGTHDLFSSLFFYALKEYDGFSMHSWSLRLFMILLQETAFCHD